MGRKRRPEMTREKEVERVNETKESTLKTQHTGKYGKSHRAPIGGVTIAKLLQRDRFTLL